MSVATSPRANTLLQQAWKEREEAIMATEVMTHMSSIGPLRPPPIQEYEEPDLILTPDASPPYSTASYASPGYNCPTSMQSMEALPPVSTVLMDMHMSATYVNSPSPHYVAGPPSPCDSAYHNSSPLNASPMGSPSSCGTNEHCDPFEQCDPYPLTVVQGYSPPTSSAAGSHYSPTFYGPVAHGCPPWAMQMPAVGYDTFSTMGGLPMTRSGSHHSLNDEGHDIIVINNSGHPPMMDQNPKIDFYPLTPPNSAASPPNNLVCYPELYGPPPLPLPMPLSGKQKGNRVFRKKPQKPPVEVNTDGIKDIPTSAQLWEFTLRVLKKPMYNYMVSWENQKEGLFRFHDAQAFAALWGRHRNRPSMTYDKVARALRYYYKRDILNQVGGRLTYRFSKRLNKLYMNES